MIQTTFEFLENYAILPSFEQKEDTYSLSCDENQTWFDFWK